MFAYMKRRREGEVKLKLKQKSKVCVSVCQAEDWQAQADKVCVNVCEEKGEKKKDRRKRCKFLDILFFFLFFSFSVIIQGHVQNAESGLEATV